MHFTTSRGIKSTHMPWKYTQGEESDRTERAERSKRVLLASSPGSC